MLANNNNGRLLVKLGIVLVVLAAVGYYVFSGAQKSALVKVAKTDTAVDAVTGSVTVDADGGTQKELKAEAEGKVIECDRIDRGKTFKEGDILLRLDPEELKRQFSDYNRGYDIARLQSQLALTGGKPEKMEKVANAHKLSDADRAKLYQEVSQERTLAAEKLRQVKRMHQLNNASEEDLKAAERALDNIDNGLAIKAVNDRKAEEDHEANRKNHDVALERMLIRAPSDGAITEASIFKGALIGRGHVVGKFMTHERVVTALISEESFGKVRIGQKARIRLLTYGDMDFAATVSKMLPTADDAQRFTVFFDVKVEKQSMLNPKSTGEVTITVDQHPNAIIISRLALFDVDKVCVVKNGRVERRQVKTGYVNLTEAEILEGVAAGEQVIVDTPQRYRNGDRVRVEVLP